MFDRDLIDFSIDFLFTSAAYMVEIGCIFETLSFQISKKLDIDDFLDPK